MKVGMFINTQFPEGDHVAARIPELVEQVRLARDSGFSSLLFPHHYLTAPLQMLQIAPMMAYLMREAQGMIIGGNILLLPLLNPVHVAEEVGDARCIVGRQITSSGSAWVIARANSTRSASHCAIAHHGSRKASR